MWFLFRKLQGRPVRAGKESPIDSVKGLSRKDEPQGGHETSILTETTALCLFSAPFPWTPWLEIFHRRYLRISSKIFPLSRPIIGNRCTTGSFFDPPFPIVILPIDFVERISSGRGSSLIKLADILIKRNVSSFPRLFFMSCRFTTVLNIFVKVSYAMQKRYLIILL